VQKDFSGQVSNMGSVLEARALLKRFIEQRRRATLDLQQALKEYALDRPSRRDQVAGWTGPPASTDDDWS
jgi:hypothetical protein